jgi:hypothetical protein
MSNDFQVPQFHIHSSPISSSQSSPVLQPISHPHGMEYKMNEQPLSSTVTMPINNNSSSPTVENHNISKHFLPSKPEEFNETKNAQLWLMSFKNYCLAVGVPSDKVVRLAVAQGRGSSFLLWWNSGASLFLTFCLDLFTNALRGVKPCFGSFAKHLFAI